MTLRISGLPVILIMWRYLPILYLKQIRFRSNSLPAPALILRWVWQEISKVDGKFLGASFSSEENIKWSNDDPSTFDYEEGAGYGIMKRFDYGVNVMAGIESRGAVFSVNYGLGLAKLQSVSNSSADDKNKHRGCLVLKNVYSFLF
jgi:hypothetical protein